MNINNDTYYMIRSKTPGNQSKPDNIGMTPFSREMLERMRQGDLACGTLQKSGMANRYGSFSTRMQAASGSAMTGQSGAAAQDFEVTAYSRHDLENFLDRLLMEKVICQSNTGAV